MEIVSQKYKHLVLEALKYQIGDIKKTGTSNIFLTDKFIFKFPRLNKKEDFMVYAYDRDELNYHDRKVDGVLIYSGGQWVKNGTWIDELKDYMSKIEIELNENKIALNEKLLKILYEKDKYDLELTHQIGKTFNDNVFENGALLSSVVNLEHNLPIEFDNLDTIQTFLMDVFNIEIFSVLR